MCKPGYSPLLNPARFSFTPSMFQSVRFRVYHLKSLHILSSLYIPNEPQSTSLGRDQPGSSPHYNPESIYLDIVGETTFHDSAQSKGCGVPW
jgi:hypothetical protein